MYGVLARVCIKYLPVVFLGFPDSALIGEHIGQVAARKQVSRIMG